jgi:hypothetical protein
MTGLHTFTLTPATMAHVVALERSLRAVEQRAVSFALEHVAMSHAWAAMAGSETLAIAGVVRGGLVPWGFAAERWVGRREFPAVALALLEALRTVRPGIAPHIPAEPYQANGWFYSLVAATSLAVYAS